MTLNTFAMLHDGHTDTLPISLHITGPSQCPRVDKPHLASIAGTLLPVAGRARKEVDRPRVTVADGHNWHFPPGYSVLVWRTEQVFCSPARTESENQQIRAILKNSNKINKLNNSRSRTLMVKYINPQFCFSNDTFNSYNCNNTTWVFARGIAMPGKIRRK